MSLDEPRFLGTGRSGSVYLEVGPEGRVASRRFHGSFLSDMIHYFLTGAPNPYIWNENAVWSAFYSRKIMSDLVEVWFGQKLKVAQALEVRLNEKERAYELRAEYIDGTHASLRHIYSEKGSEELSDLVNKVMKPLQAHLVQAGFDGHSWQAGRGNPSAIGNFLRQDDDSESKWAWTDMESGVPVVIPLTSITQVPYFVSNLRKYGRALFDDVDLQKLRGYIDKNKDEMVLKLGNERYTNMLDNVKQLDHHQTHWKSVKWANRSVKYRLLKKHITPDQAEFYFEHPMLWVPKETLTRLHRVANKVAGEAPWDLYNNFVLGAMSAYQRKAWRYLYSQDYRVERAKEHYMDRIDEMQRRKMLTPEDAGKLRERLDSEHTAEYLADFGFHNAMRIPDRILHFFVYPPLFLAGAIDAWTLAHLETWTGPALRTSYSLIRMAQGFASNEKTKEDRVYPAGLKGVRDKVLDTTHLVSLAIGSIPVAGIFAYPVESVVRPSVRDSSVAQFILDDSFARLSRFVPFFGGKNTKVEHYLNRLPGKLFGYATKYEK